MEKVNLEKTELEVQRFEKPKKLITPKYVLSKLNLDWTTEDFCEDLGVSEEILMDFMRKHSNNKVYADFPRMLKQNEQNAEKKARAAEKRLQNTEKKNASASEEATNIPEKGSETEEASSTLVRKDEEVQESFDPATIKINALCKELEGKERVLKEKESKKLSLSSEHSKSTASVKELKTKIENLEGELKHTKQSLAVANTNVTILKNQLEAADNEIRKTLEEIDNISIRIKELKKITVTAYRNGDISTNKNLPIPRSWEGIYSQLLLDSLVENITIKQVQQLAKLIALNNMLSSSPENYFEFIFEYGSSERDSLKTLFELLT